ncbi:MAG TPA: isoprenylcysteine carboxylmethyltransferase family protein [Polyangiales bacterium]|nr:isoprenylcysteine carboxylmethyltransferase family protein [Polyangiales bacterium]
MYRPASLPLRAAYLSFGVACYTAFQATILYAIGFVGNSWSVLGHDSALRSMDQGATSEPTWLALAIDALLIALFGLQHSCMARPRFKAWWTRIVPAEIERSTYVLAASACLALLFWQWRPLVGAELWHVSHGPLAIAWAVLAAIGWGIAFASTFMLDHLDLFGLRQVWYAFRGRPYPSLGFATPGLYRAVRHPIYLGFLIAFWATPVMTVGRLVFAGGMTIYVLTAIRFEERDLMQRYGAAYGRYRARVRMLLPLPTPREPRDSQAHGRV